MGYALLLLPPAFVLALLFPLAERAVGGMNARGAYAERYNETEIPLPDKRADVLAVLDALLDTMPSGDTLTEDEQTVLAYMIDGQHTDVIAHFMNIPLKKVRTLSAAVISKFGFNTKNELIAHMGAVNAEIGRRERIPTLFEKYGLTQREKEIFQAILTASNEQERIQGDELPDIAGREALLSSREKDVALLMIDGETRRDISRKLHITAMEVSRSVDAIREKVIRTSDPDPVISFMNDNYKLTHREVDVLRCLRRKMTNAEIAAELFLSEETVKVHVRNLLKKLPVNNRQDVAAWNGASE
jgi:DNA-binding CsgD family transcriptional regulator